MSDEVNAADVIRLTGLGGVGRHGVLPEERRTGQLFKVDVSMHLDTRAAAEQDDLDLSVDYSAVAADVVAIIEGEPVNLIETLAARIADAVLGQGAVQRVEVTVHKPEAPVGVPFADVEVTIVRGAVQAAVAVPAVAPPVVAEVHDEGVPALDAAAADVVARPERDEVDLDAEPDEPVEVVLSLGGNVGDVRATLRAAIDELAGSGVLEVIGVAPLAKTAAVLQPDAVAQADFLNTVVLARTTASPRAVLGLTREIESGHGRVRGARWGERTLDIDVITYGSVSTADPELSLPHPRANERAFVLVPWAHLDPDAFLPGLGGGPVAALAETAPDRDGVRWLALDWYTLQPGSAAAAPPPEADDDVSTSRVDTGARRAAAAEVAAEPEVAEPEEPQADEADEPEEPQQDAEPELPEVIEPEPVEPEQASVPEAEPEAEAAEPEPAAESEAPDAAEPEADEPSQEPESEQPEAAEAEKPEAPDAEDPVHAPAEPDAPSAPREPWDEPASDATRIRPRWEPLRREDRDADH